MTVEELIEREIRALFFKEVVQVVIAKAVASAPFLGWPVVGWFFAAFMNFIATKFWNEAKLHGIFMSIDIEEGGKKVEYINAVNELHDALKNPDNEDEKERAKENYREKLRNLIKLNSNSAAA